MLLLMQAMQAIPQAAAYTAGNHWLMLWSLVVTVLSTWLILRSGILTTLAVKLSGKGLFNRAFRVSAAFGSTEARVRR